MSTYRLRLVDGVLVGVAVLLTLATGYIHFWVGGPLLLLNAGGYLFLATTTVVVATFSRRLLPLVLIGLAAYAAATIVGWLIMGPYFDIAYLAKGIEITLITTIGLFVVRNRSWTRESISWAIGLPRRILGSRRERTAPSGASVEPR